MLLSAECELKHYMKELIPEVVDILSENDFQFTTLHGTQDTVLLSMGREHDLLKLLQFSQDRRIFSVRCEWFKEPIRMLQRSQRG